MISPGWRLFLALYVLGGLGLIRLVYVGYSPKGIWEQVVGR